MKGSFSEEALRAYSELAAEKQGLDFAEGDSYDFTRCVRPDGSTYGTGGRCRKGTETGAKESSAPVAPGQKTSNKKSAVKLKTAIKELEQRIARQKAFLSRMSPGKYTAREREIEKKTLQEMVSRLAGMKSTTRSGKDGAAKKRGLDFAEGDSYDFTRCVKPNGTAYGTKGQCKSGSPQEETDGEKRNKKVAQIGVPIPEGESAEDVLQRMLPKGAVVHRPSRLA